MLIKKIQWDNHPVLGNLLLDFSTPDEKSAYKTIILAGENGAGKSTILEHLSSFLNRDTITSFQYIEYIVDGEILKAILNDPSIKYDPHSLKIIPNNQLIKATTSSYDDIIENTKDIRHYGCIYSRARANYKTEVITSTTTSSLNSSKYDVDNNDDFTFLKQLIIDISSQDYTDYSNINMAQDTNEKPAVPWGEFYKSSKTYRFKEAFNNFFDNMKFERVEDIDNEKSLVFKKDGKTISIDNLSTGEKQIVFRGTHLLKNSEIIQNGTVFIDEPELSMHPKWQKKILDYYKNLFTNNEDQIVQLFIATHSDHVIQSALQDEDTLIITIERNQNEINPKHYPISPSPTSVSSAEINYTAFDLPTTDYHIELYGKIQDRENKLTVKSCDDFISSHSSYKEAIHKKESSFNKTQYNTLPTYIRNSIHHPSTDNGYTDDEIKTSIQLLLNILGE